MMRRCEECPAWTQTVCRHAFGRFWEVRSGGGEGCLHPLDGVAEAWRKAGWKPDAQEAAKTAPVSVPAGGGIITLSVPSDAPQLPLRASGAIVPKMPRRPQRPKVSDAIARQAETFFKGLRNG